jgi:hypothetical protein
VHPSSILRAPDDERESAYRAFVGDMKAIAKAIQEEPARSGGSARPRPQVQAQTQMDLFASEEKEEKAHPDRKAPGRSRARKSR